MRAEVVTETKEYILCPGCGADRQFNVYAEHHRQGRWGPWICYECGTAITGRFINGAYEIEVSEQDRRAKALVLVEIGESKPPVYVMFRHMLYQPNTPEAWSAGGPHGYYINEHTCPTNLFAGEDSVLAFIHDGDSDPHGVLRLVQLIPEPDDFDEDNVDWQMLFSALRGEIVEGELSAKKLIAS